MTIQNIVSYTNKLMSKAKKIRTRMNEEPTECSLHSIFGALRSRLKLINLTPIFNNRPFNLIGLCWAKQLLVLYLA